MFLITTVSPAVITDGQTLTEHKKTSVVMILHVNNTMSNNVSIATLSSNMSSLIH